jgi:hypothetical protein
MMLSGQHQYCVGTLQCQKRSSAKTCEPLAASSQRPSRTNDVGSTAVIFRKILKFVGKTTSSFRRSVDIVLPTSSPEELKEVVRRVENAGKEYNMRII